MLTESKNYHEMVFFYLNNILNLSTAVTLFAFNKLHYSSGEV